MDKIVGDFSQAERIDEVTSGLNRAWYFDKRLVVYQVTKVTPKLLDTWSDLVIQTLTDWPKEHPYLAMHDLSAPGVAMIYASLTSYDMLNLGVTPDGRLRAEEIFNQHLDFRAKVSVTFNLTLSGHIGKTLVNIYLDKHPSVQYKSFYGQDGALRWLTADLNASAAGV